MDASQQLKFQNPGREFMIPSESLSGAQRALVARMEAGPRRTVPINQRIWMHNMPFAEVAEKFGAYVSAEAPMSPRIKEICILVVASFWQSRFEWHWHAKAAHAKGITAEQTEAIRANASPAFDDPKERVAYEVVNALTFQRNVPDALYRESMEVLGLDATLDLIGLMGLYGMIAHTIMLFELKVPD